jgi:hypothetical protein
VLNHPNPALPELNINSSFPFGIITAKGNQAQVRVDF